MESTTESVIDWIKFLGHDVDRINGDVFESLEKDLLLDSSEANLYIAKEQILKNYYSIWIRRWSDLNCVQPLIKHCQDLNIDTKLVVKLKDCLTQDVFSTERAVMQMINCKKHLTTLNQMSVDKINVLNLAKNVKLNIPEFILTNQKSNVVKFKKKKKKVILKDFGSHFTYYNSKTKTLSSTYGELLNTSTINSLPQKFFISFFQEYIDKEYEIRSFFLNNQIYSMAIFSQNDPQTSIDFRRYNREKASRTVPYTLPVDIEKKLIKLMNLLKLNTGSIDILKSITGKYYFLEINPVGQFGMVSWPCNYNLELKVAKYLTS